MNSTLFVRFIERQANGVGVVHALYRGDAREVSDGADQDFGVGDATLGFGEGGGCEQYK